MIRRDLILLLICAAIALPITASAEQPNAASSKVALERARQRFERLPHPTEAERSDYIVRLIRLRERVARLKGDQWQPFDAEIKRHPAPSDSVELSRRLVGKWQSPRHDYLYQSDGTWTMLPADEGTTHGTWRIEGNQYVDTASLYPDKPSQSTVILINQKYFVTADDDGVFYETRLK